MSKPIVLFGASGLASLARHSLVHDARRDVVAYTVDAAYAERPRHDGLPVIPLEALPECFPPETCAVVVALGYTRMNAVRRERCVRLRDMGYALERYVSSRAIVPPDTVIRDNVLVYEGCILQPYAELGENITLRAGANIGHHSRVGSHSFIASGVTTGGNVTIGEHCVIGLGAVLRDKVQIGECCFVGAGAVVIGDTEPGSVYVGNPARRLDKRSLEVC